MLRLLSEDGIEVIGDQLMPASITPEIERLRPDVVVIDLDQTESQQLCELVRSVWPHTKVVLWASTEDVMEVIDPGATKPRWVLSGVPEDLLAEVSSLQVTPAEE
jgi:DNA-binding NarL/FixJ family response regulator